MSAWSKLLNISIFNEQMFLVFQFISMLARVDLVSKTLLLRDFGQCCNKISYLEKSVYHCNKTYDRKLLKMN